MRLIDARHIDFGHGGQRVLQNVSMSLDEGEIVTIVGPNGSGKSTLLRLLIGALKPQKGSVTRASGLRIGYVPQNLHIDPTLPITVARFLNLPKPVPAKAATEALRTAGVAGLDRQQMSQLSGGQFQRVLLVLEGIYSMDGDFPDLPRFVEVKRRHRVFLMVDEAHALGVLGAELGGLAGRVGLDGGAVPERGTGDEGERVVHVAVDADVVGGGHRSALAGAAEGVGGVVVAGVVEHEAARRGLVGAAAE